MHVVADHQQSLVFQLVATLDVQMLQVRMVASECAHPLSRDTFITGKVQVPGVCVHSQAYRLRENKSSLELLPAVSIVAWKWLIPCSEIIVAIIDR